MPPSLHTFRSWGEQQPKKKEKRKKPILYAKIFKRKKINPNVCYSKQNIKIKYKKMITISLQRSNISGPSGQLCFLLCHKQAAALISNGRCEPRRLDTSFVIAVQKKSVILIPYGDSYMQETLDGRNKKIHI